MYEVILFLHLLGVAALLGALSFSLGGFARATRAETVQDVRSSLSFLGVADRLVPPAMLVLLASGLWMVGDAGWGWDSGWVVVSIGIFVLMGILGTQVEDPRIALIRDEADAIGNGPITPELDALRRDPLLTHVACFGAAQVVVFLFLMTNKPGWGGALAALAIGGAVSLAPARALLRGSEAGPATAPV